jgi:hypothetical protein
VRSNLRLNHPVQRQALARLDPSVWGSPYQSESGEDIVKDRADHEKHEEQGQYAVAEAPVASTKPKKSLQETLTPEGPEEFPASILR